MKLRPLRNRTLLPPARIQRALRHQLLGLRAADAARTAELRQPAAPRTIRAAVAGVHREPGASRAARRHRRAARGRGRGRGHRGGAGRGHLPDHERAAGSGRSCGGDGAQLPVAVGNRAGQGLPAVILAAAADRERLAFRLRRAGRADPPAYEDADRQLPAQPQRLPAGPRRFRAHRRAGAAAQSDPLLG